MGQAEQIEQKLSEQERKKVVWAGPCKQCFEGFTITEGEKQHFESKGFALPKRCPKCRAQNKTSRPSTLQMPLDGGAA